MARFLIDEDLPRSLSALLRQSGHERDHLIDLQFRGASDAVVFKLAQERRAVLVSHDLGFANTLRYPLGTHLGLVVARYPSAMRIHALVTEIVESLTTLGESEFEGALIILEPRRVRIRRSTRGRRQRRTLLPRAKLALDFQLRTVNSRNVRARHNSTGARL